MLPVSAGFFTPPCVCACPRPPIAGTDNGQSRRTRLEGTALFYLINYIDVLEVDQDPYHLEARIL
jgi:hypothetical protein